MGRRNLATIVGGIALLVSTSAACGGSPAATGTSTSSPSAGSAAALYQAAIADGRAAVGLRYTVELSSKTGAGAIIAADVSALGGSETESVVGGGKISSVTVELVGNIAFVKGDAGGLTSIPVGIVNAATARRYAGRWIAVPASSASFSAITSALTLGSVFKVLQLEQLSRRSGGPYKVAGQDVVELNAIQIGAPGTAQSTCRMSITTGQHPLPVQITCNQGGGGASVAISFKDWQRPAPISPPLAAVPVSQVLASRPASTVAP